MRDPYRIVSASIVSRVHVLRAAVLGLKIEGGQGAPQARLGAMRGQCSLLKQPVEALAQRL
jgi:hypothetical protein